MSLSRDDVETLLSGASADPRVLAMRQAALAAGQSVLIEQFFGRPQLRTAELLHLQQKHAFEPFQILCRADGRVLLERFLTRAAEKPHASHQYLKRLEHNKEQFLTGHLAPLTIGGQIVEIDTTTPNSLDYTDLLQQVRTVLRRGAESL